MSASTVNDQRIAAALRAVEAGHEYVADALLRVVADRIRQGATS